MTLHYHPPSHTPKTSGDLLSGCTLSTRSCLCLLLGVWVEGTPLSAGNDPGCCDKRHRKFWWLFIAKHRAIRWDITQSYPKETLSFGITWMSLEGVMLREISQTEKAKHQMSLILGISRNGKAKRIETERKSWLESWGDGERLVKGTHFWF